MNVYKHRISYINVYPDTLALFSCKDFSLKIHTKINKHVIHVTVEILEVVIVSIFLYHTYYINVELNLEKYTVLRQN